MASAEGVKYYESSKFIQSENIQELVKKPLASVPERYIRVNSHEPPVIQNETFSDPEIPTINMEKLISGEAAQLELQKLHSACKDWGLFQLVHHGISPAVLEKLKYEIEEFFKLPLQEKMKYKIRPGDVEGYGGLNRSDQKVDWGDRFYMTTNPLHRRKPHLFPELPTSFRTMLDSYIVELEKIAMTLLGLLAKLLKIEKKEMVEVFEDGMQSVRMTYYPPCPQPELVLGINAHSDASGITILNQVNGVHGLQIKKDGTWITVNAPSDALVVNIGDILEIMSNGAYKSVEHRVTVNSDKERISIAMFFNPKFESEIGPVTSLTNAQNPPLFRRIGIENYVKEYFFSPYRLNGKSYLEHMKIDNEVATGTTV